MLIYVGINFLLLWTTYVNGNKCNEGCVQCPDDNLCTKCEDGYFLKLYRNAAECSKCSLTCKTCSRIEDCLSCIPALYGNRCEHSCSLCKNDECNSYGCVNGCKSGNYLKQTRYDICKKCPYRCTECTSKYVCSSCKSGWWGDGCLYSCIPCSQCVSTSCMYNCREKHNSQCENGNSRCPDKCYLHYSWHRSNETVSSSTLQTPTTLTTHLSTTTVITRPTRRETPTGRITLGPTRRTTLRPTRRTTPRLTTLSKPFTTRRQTQLITQPSKPQTSTGATSTTDGQVTPTLYILIAVIGVLVLVVAIMVVIFIKKRKQTSHRDHVSSSPVTQAESRQLTDNAMGTFTVRNDDNAIGNLATINVAESDTGYVDMNTIGNVATINVPENDTGYGNTNTTSYMNIVDNITLNADPIETVNTYEALSQYTDVKEAENAYTALSGNENVYYTIPD